MVRGSHRGMRHIPQFVVIRVTSSCDGGPGRHLVSTCSTWCHSPLSTSPATAALSPCGPSTAGRPGHRVVQSIPIFVESAQGSPWLAPGTARFVLEKWKGEGNTLDAGGSGEECIDTVQGAQGEECSSSLTGRITEMDDRYSGPLDLAG